jgi:branched-chain amino acid transport system permease protein
MEIAAQKARRQATWFDWRAPVRAGMLGGVAALLIGLVGMLVVADRRPIIPGVISMGQTLLIILLGLSAVLVVRQVKESKPPAGVVILSGALASLVTSAMLAILVLVGQAVDLRVVLANASPELYTLLTFGLGNGVGLVALLLGGAVLGALLGAILVVDARHRLPLLLGIGIVPLVGILNSALFSGRGIQLPSAVLVFAVVVGGTYAWDWQRPRVQQRLETLSPDRKRILGYARWGVPVVAVLALPALGSYPAEVLDMIGIYILMGIGLNIVVGFAGLLDLGYVAFFAIGAYTIGVLTSPEIGWLGIQLTFWEALPVAVILSTLSGIILGIPVLGMRGDYLAIVTLGFGEIIRLVALSDWLKPLIGGSNGITRIPKPIIGPIALGDPQSLYYLILAGCLLAAFVSGRLKDSKLGRAWMAMREDEDVAQAMGINLVGTKLLAFATGAAFSGLSGAIFASKLTSIYPHSFQLLISINVLCLIIVGGMGSIPGVIAGSLALVGLPEILREFAEYRWMMYGAALVLMMLTRPEGLMPEARRRLELHGSDDGSE